MVIKDTKPGFTLMEILISIAIIAVLTAIGIVSYSSINRGARNAKRRADIEQIRSALELYRSDLGFYPAVHTSALGDADDLVESDPNFSTYLSQIPRDPKGVEYMYKATGLNGGSYYGYCLAAQTEPTDSKDTTCSVSDLPVDSIYNYGRKNP